MYQFPSALCHGRHFDDSIIILRVGWYITHKPSYRDLVVAGIAVVASSLALLVFGRGMNPTHAVPGVGADYRQAAEEVWKDRRGVGRRE